MALLIPSENSTLEVSAAAIGKELSGRWETRQGATPEGPVREWRGGEGKERSGLALRERWWQPGN